MTTTKKPSLTSQNRAVLKEIETYADKQLKIIAPKFSKKLGYKNAYHLYTYAHHDLPTKIIMYKKEATIDELLSSIYTQGHIAYNNKTLIRDVRDATLKAVQQELVQNLPNEVLPKLRSSPVLMELVNETLSSKAESLVGTLDEMVANINKTYEDESDIELLKILKKLKGSSLTGAHYVTAAVTKPIVVEMSKKTANKMPLLAYITGRLHTIQPSLAAKDSIIKHPGQIIQAVKDEYLIENRHWKHFLKMTPSVLNHNNAYISVLLHIELNKPTAMVSKIMNKTQIPDLMANVRRELANVPNLDIEDEQKVLTQKRLQKNYVALCGLVDVLKHVKVGDFHNFDYEIRDTVDYLRARHRETHEYPHHFTWNAYIKRTREWHHQIQRQRAIERAGNKLYKWNSLIPTCEIDDYKVTPLVDSPALVAEGESMHHCVGGYWRTAMNNDSRLFHIEHKDNPKDVGTLCLTPSHNAAGGLSINQLRGPYNSNVSEPLRRIGNRVLTRYRNMLKRTEPRLHIWTQEINVLTDEVIKTVGFPDEDVTLKDEDAEDLENLDQENDN